MYSDFMQHTTQPAVCKEDKALFLLAEAMQTEKIDFWLQGIADEFQGEYPPDCAKRLTFLSGFTGSAGLGVFRATKGKHTLFVDGRYTLQAAQETDRDEFDIVNSGDVSLAEWLEKEVAKAVAIGFDPWLVSEQQIGAWKKATAALQVTWRAVRPNLVDSIWGSRPETPEGEVVLHAIAFAGATYQDKRAQLLTAMTKSRADTLVITQADAVNWLLNIRGDDIPYNPLLLSYFVLTKAGEGTLYTYERSFSAEVKKYLKDQKVAWGSIADIFGGSERLFAKDSRVMLDPSLAAHGWWIRAEKEGWKIISADDPSQLPKACKNPAELEGMRSAHVSDGLALSKFFHWFESRVRDGQLPDELDVNTELLAFREAGEGYKGPSFPTIAGSGPHGAIVHYRASKQSNRRAQAGELFLLDSGGQYEGGTTDVTRTLFVPAPKGGMPSADIKDHYTRVLKGHIALAMAVFPEGTSGVQLDALARQYLWQAGLDYDHGTGHGVGAHLCVHEGPQRISKRGSAVALKEGMILSNEPGFYLEGKYGIRIENLVVVVKVGETAQGKPQYGFETLTLAPIDTRPVDIRMLTSDERNWLNDYHQRVYKAHVNQLDDAERQWLAEATRAI